VASISGWIAPFAVVAVALVCGMVLHRRWLWIAGAALGVSLLLAFLISGGIHVDTDVTSGLPLPGATLGR
jgi:hypothetical protein